MKRAMLKRGLTFGALMALVITGNAMAAQRVDQSGDYPYTTSTEIQVEMNPQHKHNVSITAEGQTLNFVHTPNRVNHGLKFDNLSGSTITINGKELTFKGNLSNPASYGILLQFNNIANIYGESIAATGSWSGLEIRSESILNLGNNNTKTIIINKGTTAENRSITVDGGAVANIIAKDVTVTGEIRLAGKDSDTGKSSVINFGTQNTLAGNINLQEGIVVSDGAVLNSNSTGFNAKSIVVSAAANETIVNLNSDNIQLGYLDANRGKVDIESNELTIGENGNVGEAIHLKSFENVVSELNIESEKIIINGDINTTDRDGGIVNINQNLDDAIVIINGDIKTGYDYNNPVDTIQPDEGSYKTNNSTVNINLSGVDSVLNGNIYDYNYDDNGSGAIETSGTNISFLNGATWNVTGDSTAKEVTVDNAQINLNADKEQKVNITTLNGIDSNITVNDLTKDQITIGTNNSTGLQVTGTSNATKRFNSSDLAGSMQQLVDTVGIGTGNQLDSALAQESDILPEITALVDDNGNVIINSIRTKGHVANEGITELANVAFMAWRAENDEMHQRMGELRSSKGEAGIWARMKRGESKYGDMNIKNQYSTYQLGYDEKVGDSNWYIGGAISRTEGKSSFATGSGENQSTGFTVYGTYVADDGQYVDLSAKYARLDNEFDVFGRSGIESTGDYRNNGYAFSAEYGKRIEAGNDFWVEPQVQLTYGHLSSANYTTSRDVRVTQDAMDSVVGRLGFAAGKDIGAGNVYVKASYLYDFDGDTSVKMTDGINSAVYDQDLGGGWFEVGIGTNINLSETSHLYFDVEKTYGGDIETPWQWNAGVRFDF